MSIGRGWSPAAMGAGASKRIEMTEQRPGQAPTDQERDVAGRLASKPLEPQGHDDGREMLPGHRAGRQMGKQFEAVRTGLANGSVERGQTVREARGMGKAPTWGAILLPDQVDAVTPPLGRGLDVVAWEVVGSVSVEGLTWRGPVVGIRVVAPRYM